MVFQHHTNASQDSKASTSLALHLHHSMGGRVPLEVGTRGTIGSLLKREIDYFRKVELERSQRSSEEMASGGRSSWPSFRFSLMSSWRRKKRRNSGIRPGMVEVADIRGRGFGYLNLRVDSERFEL